jgi:MFS family permease
MLAARRAGPGSVDGRLRAAFDEVRAGHADPDRPQETNLAVLGIIALELVVLYVLVPAALSAISVTWATAAVVLSAIVIATTPKPTDPPTPVSARRIGWAMIGGLAVFALAATAIAQSPTYAGPLLLLYVAAAILAALVASVATGSPVRRQRLLVGLVVAALSSIGLAVPITAAGLPSTSCPAGRWEGRLSSSSSEGLVGIVPSASAERFEWPFGYVVRGYRPTPEAAFTLVVTDLLGNEKVREGETVALGGGEIRTGLWQVCRAIEITKPA